MGVEFKEYNTSDTVVEFVARNEKFPIVSTFLVVCSGVTFLFVSKLRVSWVEWCVWCDYACFLLPCCRYDSSYEFLFFSFDLQVPAVLLLCLAFYSMWNTVVEESITVIKEFGIQIKTKYLFNISEDVLVCLYLLRI